MALHWLAKVPWNEIISNAPLIVQGAKKLTGALKKPPGAPQPDDVSMAKGDLREQVAALEARIAKLEAVDRSSADVIQSLAANSEQVAEALRSLKVQATWNFRLAVVSLIGVIVLAVVLAFG